MFRNRRHYRLRCMYGVRRPEDRAGTALQGASELSESAFLESELSADLTLDKLILKEAAEGNF